MKGLLIMFWLFISFRIAFLTVVCGNLEKPWNFAGETLNELSWIAAYWRWLKLQEIFFFIRIRWWNFTRTFRVVNEHSFWKPRFHVANNKQIHVAQLPTQNEQHRAAAAISGSWWFPFYFVKSSVISDLNEQLLRAPQNETNSKWNRNFAGLEVK